MKILHVISDTDRRGAQVFALDLAAALSQRGHWGETVALTGGRRGELSVNTLGPTPRSPRGLSALRAKVRAFDVTVAHGSDTGPACALATIGTHRPFVYRQISDSRFWAPTKLRRRRVRLTLSRAHLVVALSDFNRAQLVEWIGVDPARIRVVPNGVPAGRFAPADDAQRDAARAALGLGAEPTVLFVGALVPEKGADLAIQGAAALAGAGVLIVGDGPQRRTLESLAAERAPGRVRFLGSLDDVVPAYHAADAVVFPSRGGDAMPAALIEAGLCGLPVVATAVGAIPEVVVDGRTGIVIDEASPETVADAVAALLADPGRRAAMGAAAREHCARYSIDAVAAEWEAVLREAAS